MRKHDDVAPEGAKSDEEMGRVMTDEFKQQLLNRIDIVDVIERHVQLRKAGQNYVARCPFHAEKTPSFSVSPAKQFYHCFGCGAHGNAISFVMEHGGFGYIEAVKELASMVGMTVPEARDTQAFATTIAKDEGGKLRILVTELDKGAAVRFHAQTLLKKQ